MWLSEGNQNSRFFHASAKNRRRANHIEILHDKNGQLVVWETGLKETMVDYFNELFKASDTEWDEVVRGIDTKVTSGQNEALLAPVEGREVKKGFICYAPG